MIQKYYLSMFILSMLCSTVFVYMWHKHFDANFTMVFTLVPVSCLGYMFLSRATCLEEAILAQKIVYIGGSFLQLFILLSILGLCKVNVRRPVRTLLFIISASQYAMALTIGHGDLFYRSVAFEIKNGNPILYRDYGFLHTLFYFIICLYFAAGIAIIIYSWFRNKQVPRMIICLLVIPDIICLVSYFCGRNAVFGGELVPAGFVLAECMYLLIAYRVNLYDVSDTVIDTLVREGAIGYVSFDFKNRYLGSNETAKQLMPFLRDFSVDQVLDGSTPSGRRLAHYLEQFEADENKNTFVHTVHAPDGKEDDERIYNVSIKYLYDGSRRRGYMILFTDDTQNRRYIRLLDSYNEDLKNEVEEKTHHIVEMHDNLIMSLAMMVESRDNSTGGHIKRTSQGVRILMDEIVSEGKLNFTPEFCRNIVKAAPMHDLGKIAVDDAVLRKPGRFTNEEFAKMKQHAAEGARVIHEILLHTDDKMFKTVAENVAHYHHERWDGSGYPNGLAGEAIPVEARIMAIADVYDALVSKRVYKEAFDFEKADSIIMEGMGSQFDPQLKTAYEKARPRLEAYYTAIAESEG